MTHGICHHCPLCHVCYPDYKAYIEHFRVNGRLVFTSCSNQERA